MKTSRIASAVSSIDDDLIAGACQARTIKRKSWHKGGFLAACFAVLLVSVVAAVSLLFSDSLVSFLPGGNEETYEKGYFYSIDQGPFSSYVGGKVIAEDKIGNKISDVLVTAVGRMRPANGFTKRKSFAAKFIQSTVFPMMLPSP